MKVLNGKIHLYLLFIYLFIFRATLTPRLPKYINVPISTKKFIWGKGAAKEEVSGGSFLNMPIYKDDNDL